MYIGIDFHLPLLLNSKDNSKYHNNIECRIGRVICNPLNHLEQILKEIHDLLESLISSRALKCLVRKLARVVEAYNRGCIICSASNNLVKE